MPTMKRTYTDPDSTARCELRPGRNGTVRWLLFHPLLKKDIGMGIEGSQRAAREEAMKHIEMIRGDLEVVWHKLFDGNEDETR